jgi:hypothetical protein
VTLYNLHEVIILDSVIKGITFKQDFFTMKNVCRYKNVGMGFVDFG